VPEKDSWFGRLRAEFDIGQLVRHLLPNISVAALFVV
jgi:hypothetical protein